MDFQGYVGLLLRSIYGMSQVSWNSFIYYRFKANPYCSISKGGTHCQESRLIGSSHAAVENLAKVFLLYYLQRRHTIERRLLIGRVRRKKYSPLQNANRTKVPSRRSGASKSYENLALTSKNLVCHFTY